MTRIKHFDKSHLKDSYILINSAAKQCC